MTEFSAADAGHLRATLAEAHGLAIAGRFPFTARLVDVTGAVVATAANECDLQ